MTIHEWKLYFFKQEADKVWHVSIYHNNKDIKKWVDLILMFLILIVLSLLLLNYFL